ncbi:hypothetical protein F5J12DRAFT_783618 [Pisolithus orientalis]|uniref:uncharacterized protein n=1 Tax=Pisolithus orientalis TaxID=936130 RepID=UPI0022250FEC|nr:uncharacterized protein F5J12DRAFT_783618 [Pisolithus orientalis]KAI6003175.1 hypothetical protein F5J12DRAFT_783618 [Pisolithus orientalis]
MERTAAPRSRLQFLADALAGQASRGHAPGSYTMVLATGRAEVSNTVTPNAGPQSKLRVDEHADCSPKPCLYLGSGSWAIYRGVEITCRWEGCFQSCGRHNFVRHVREKHLGHTRGSAAGRRQHASFHGMVDDAEGSKEPHTKEHADRVQHLCQYQDLDKGLCMREITYATVSMHFATYHGVKAMSRRQMVACLFGMLPNNTDKGVLVTFWSIDVKSLQTVIHVDAQAKGPVALVRISSSIYERGSPSC